MEQALRLEQQRNARDLTVFARQRGQLEASGFWKSKYEEAMKWLKPALHREELYCLEIAELRKQLEQSKAECQRWQNRDNHILEGEANG